MNISFSNIGIFLVLIHGGFLHQVMYLLPLYSVSEIVSFSPLMAHLVGKPGVLYSMITIKRNFKKCKFLYIF